jgi:hypothetical protein
VKIAKALLVTTLLISTQSVAATSTPSSNVCRMDFRMGGYQFITCLAGLFR